MRNEINDTRQIVSVYQRTRRMTTADETYAKPSNASQMDTEKESEKSMRKSKHSCIYVHLKLNEKPLKRTQHAPYTLTKYDLKWL